MEYLFVKFDPNDRRDVFANGDPIGRSDTTLMLDSDFYEISLSGIGFAPDKWSGNISGTLATAPLTIEFKKRGAR